MSLYVLKMIAFSVIACVPTYFVRPVLLNFFEGHNRFISYGLPTLGTALVFGITGILLLLIFQDKSAKTLLGKVLRKGRK